MPSITTYSSYETLVFFQSVARYGADASALQDISTTLKQNELIHTNPNFDEHRLSADALRRLHQEYIGVEDDKGVLRVNGDVGIGERSPKRRKLSNSSNSSTGAFPDDSRMLQKLVDRLYTSYKDQVIQDIKQEEDVWANLQEEIRALEQQIDAENKQHTSNRAAQSPKTDAQIQDGASNAEANEQNALVVKDAQKSQIQAESVVPNANSIKAVQPTSNESLAVPPLALPRQNAKSPHPSDVNPSQSVSNVQSSRNTQTPGPLPSQTRSPVPYAHQIPSPSPQRPGYNTVQAQTAYSPAQVQVGSGHIMPQIAGVQQRPTARGHPVNSQGRGSPIPYQPQHTFPPYPPYPPPPQWHPHMSPQQYQQHPAYGPPPQYYPQPTSNRHPQTPQQLSYPSYPYTAPMPYLPQQQHWRGQPWPVQPSSAITTPVSRPESRLSNLGSRSSTPWKQRQQAHQLRPKTPPRPEREVSPLTDDEDSPLPKSQTRNLKKDIPRKNDDEALMHRRSRKRGRSPTVSPPAVGSSRSQSAASKASDSYRDEIRNKPRKTLKIKAEPPSTPLPAASDTEQRSSGRRGRPRSATVTSQAEGVRSSAPKRKRDTASPTSPTHSQPSMVTPAQSQQINHVHDSSFVVVSKNFAKTSQLLLNEITSHKLAGIFAKPLSERDAPGYKDLIHRPQDLKGIKAAVSKGNRAALAAIENIEGDNEATPIKVQPIAIARAGPGPIGNGFYLVPKTAELVPPKGIVNSSQLEMELVRMFANAVMFNPLQPSERGFGKGLRLRRNGGDVLANHELEGSSTSEGSESGSSSGAEEGGIISDAREMFDGVVEVVGKWRELETERMGSGTDASASRHGSLAVLMTSNAEASRRVSVSASSNVGDDETAAGESEPASTPVPHVTSGPGRKRRRIADH